MGSLSNAMQTLVDEIHSSTENRHSAVRNICVGAHELLDRCRRELEEVAQDRQKMARALAKQLSSEMRALKSEMKTLMGEFGQAGEQRKVRISEIRSDTHNLLKRGSLERQDFTKVFARHMRQNGKTRTEEIRALRNGVRTLRNGFRGMLNEIASDVGEASQLWRGAPKKKAPPPRVAVEVEEERVEKKAVEKKLLPDAEGVLQVIQAYPDGIRLVDVGNELGVDWRTLIGFVRILLDAGKVEKIDYLYYPVKMKRKKGKR